VPIPAHPDGLDAGGRRADLEWLRVLAMGVVFLSHVSMVFSPWQDYHVQATMESRVLGSFTALVWPWVLPLFMWVSGVATWYSLERRGKNRFVRERLRRILLPLLIGTVVVAPPQLYLRRSTRGEFGGSFVEFLPRFFFDGPYPEGNLSATHLWFLGYLVTYAIVLLPLFEWLRGGGGRWLRVLQCRTATVSGLLVLPLLPILATQLWLRAPYPQTNAYVGDWANHAWMGLCFVYGFVAGAGDGPRRAARAAWPLAGAVATAGSILLAAMILQTASAAGDTLSRETARALLIPQDYSLPYVLWWTAFCLTSWSAIVFLVGAADRFLHRWTPFLDWAAPTIFPFYVFHQLVIVVAAAWIVRWPMRWPGAATTIAVLALGGTLALCEGVRRWSPTRSLFGVRVGPATERSRPRGAP